MTVYVFGNSHTVALKMARTELGRGTDDICVFGIGRASYETTPFSDLRDGQVRFLPEEYERQYLTFTSSPGITADHRIGLVMGTHNNRILRRKSWVNVAPSWMELPKTRPLSRGVLDAIIEGEQRYIRAFVQQILDVGASLFVITCAPVRHDGNLRHLRPEVVLEVDGYARRSFRDWLTEQNVPFIGPPEETIGSDGFLLDRYSSKVTPSGLPDSHHANIEYGYLLNEKIEGFLAPQ